LKESGFSTHLVQ